MVYHWFYYHDAYTLSRTYIPTTALIPINFITQLFIIISMAGLGLNVDIRSFKKAG
ncbi:hypothetical protein [Bartonella sp. JB63]|uniref:hypothetical protein n=1 Tax=unclassified Bartonella TaxID=2645622 RepID=UPI003FA4B077